ncbi:MAG: hypothetical protein ACI9QD_000471 [Thermoproteota archaeon]|jgi:hypothetical protein
MIYVFAIVSALLVYKLSQYKNFGSVNASTLVTLLSYPIIYMISAKHAPLYLSLIFGASFVGMSSNKVINTVEVIFSALIFSMLFIYFIPLLNGLGGALGLSAFLSVYLTVLVKKLIQLIPLGKLK